MTVAVLPFAGADLKVIMGHPEHDLLFVAKQVADAAGLKNGSQTVSLFTKQGGKGEDFLKVSDLGDAYNNIIDQVLDHPRIQRSSTLMTESQAYRLLLRGHAEQSESFRKWVTEEVLPSIRKTGRYDMAEHADSELVKQMSALMGEFKQTLEQVKEEHKETLETLSAEVNTLKALVLQLTTAPSAKPVTASRVVHGGASLCVYLRTPKGITWEDYQITPLSNLTQCQSL